MVHLPRSNVTITSFAFILILAFPGAYVALDKASLDSLPSTSARLKITTAGVWHNLVLCLFIWSGLNVGVLKRDSVVYRYIGYGDMNERGVVVQTVDKVREYH